jgi:hypothetical protein
MPRPEAIPSVRARRNAAAKPTVDSMKSLRSVAPVAVSVLVGVVVIAVHAQQAGRSAHIVWLTVALAESTVALLFRARHPMSALAGVLAGFLIFDFPATVIVPLAIALYTVVRKSGRRRAIVAVVATAAVVLATPALHAGRTGSGPNASVVR